MRRSVVLPEPLSPTMTTNAPRSTARLRRWKTGWIRPSMMKDFLRSLISRQGSMRRISFIARVPAPSFARISRNGCSGWYRHPPARAGRASTGLRAPERRSRTGHHGGQRGHACAARGQASIGRARDCHPASSGSATSFFAGAGFRLAQSDARADAVTKSATPWVCRAMKDFSIA